MKISELRQLIREEVREAINNENNKAVIGEGSPISSG